MARIETSPYADPRSFMPGATTGYAENRASEQEQYALYADYYGNHPGAGAQLDTTSADQSREYLGNATRDLEYQARYANDAGNAYREFIGAGPGPSAARGQLAQGAAASQAQAIALSRSGRGNMGGGEAARRAAFSNAGTAGVTSLQDQALRAQEEQAWLAREAQAREGASAAYGLGGRIYDAAGDAYAAQRQQDQTQVNNANRAMFDQDATARAWDAYGQQREGLAYDYRNAEAQGQQNYGTTAVLADQQHDDLIRAEEDRRRQVQQGKSDAARDSTWRVAAMAMPWL